MRKTITLLMAIAVSLTLSVPAGAHGFGSMSASVDRLEPWPAEWTGPPIGLTGTARGFTVLVQSDDEVRLRASVGGLVPGNAYTIWAGIFNSPEACDGVCDWPDRLNAATGFMMTFSGIGKVADDGGRVNGKSTLIEGGPLSNASGADFIFILFEHGPLVADPALQALQLTTTQVCGYGTAPAYANTPECGFVRYSLHG